MKLIEKGYVPSFHRIVWMSLSAKANWEQSIADIAEEVQRIEIVSVQEGHRDCATITFKPEDLAKYQKEYPDLIFSVLRNARIFHGFAHRFHDPVPGEPFMVHCVVTRESSLMKDFRDAHESGDHVAQGRLLGFPHCCGKFFTQVWGEGYVDPIWQIAQNSPPQKYVGQSPNVKVVTQVHPYSNPLLRYIGVRAGFHFPCTFHCNKTIESAERRMLLMNPDLRQIMEALLSLSMSWNVLHGIAEIRTPIFWIITGSVATEEKYEVHLQGSFEPKELGES
jgi:hypothetical protein